MSRDGMATGDHLGCASTRSGRAHKAVAMCYERMLSPGPELERPLSRHHGEYDAACKQKDSHVD